MSDLDVLPTLRKKRGIIKRKLTSFTKHCEKLDFASERRLSSETISELKLRLEAFEPILAEFESIQNELDLVEDDIDAQVYERESFTNSYYRVCVQVRGVLESHEFAQFRPISEASSSDVDVHETLLDNNHRNNNFNRHNDFDQTGIFTAPAAPQNSFGQQPPPAALAGAAGPPGASQQSSTGMQNVQFPFYNPHAYNISARLPPMPLPTFDGQVDKWLCFKDEFLAVVHNKAFLSETEKFHYLRSALKGQAAEVISSLTVSSDSYAHAWNLLKNRFENRKLLANEAISKILSLPQITRESALEFRALCDNVTKQIKTLELLGQPVEHWGLIITHIVTSKLDLTSRRNWEELQLNKRDQIPTIEELLEFLRNRSSLLETLHPRKVSQVKNSVSSSRTFVAHDSHVKGMSGHKCLNCGKDHLIYTCQSFLELGINEREARVIQLKLCTNCFSPYHILKKCKSSACRKCAKRHNTLLHKELEQPVAPAANAIEPRTSISGHASSFQNSHSGLQPCYILLSTAIVDVVDSRGQTIQARALLDSGSQANYVSEDFHKKLGLKVESIQVQVQGINECVTMINKKCDIHIQSKFSKFKRHVPCYITEKITQSFPHFSINADDLEIPKNLVLADPTFGQKGSVDLLLGAGLFWSLLSAGQVKMGANKPILQKTVLGWVVSGCIPLPAHAPPNISACHFGEIQNLDEQLCKFWDLEEGFHFKGVRSLEEQACEEHFAKHTKRDVTGRFIVKLPLKSEPSELGDSRSNALKRFYSTERKLARDASLRQQYNDFMKEYQDLGHMTKSLPEPLSEPEFFLPHHAVLKEDSLTSKIRVVFDGSSKTTTGLSGNDIQMVGPKLQQDILNILIKFRKHSIAVTADIEKMYRQVLVSPEDRPLQKIFWRESPSDHLGEFQLCTVTYGTASASYLAIRCLQQTAHEHAEQKPSATSVILKDFYVDDLITGGDDSESLMQDINDIVKILDTGGFHLRKWTSNKPHLLQSLNPSDASVFEVGHEANSKPLGVIWKPDDDIFTYLVKPKILSESAATKRAILSRISQIFDPLGILGPVITVAKIIMQKLWQCKLGWDESIPSDLHSVWSELESKLDLLGQVQYPRRAVLCNVAQIELHGFSDASESAYGCVIYIKSVLSDGSSTLRLLCSKGRVCPLKKTTIPKLELCAALLLAKLAEQVRSSLEIQFSRQVFWSDSQIALAWIRGFPGKWKTFVANRVAEIHALTDISDWRHVPGPENPADLVSRGLQPEQLIASTLWWDGPPWLHEQEAHWPPVPTQSPEASIPEERSGVRPEITCVGASQEDSIFDRYSSIQKLQRVTAYILRFRNNASQANSKRSGFLTKQELDHALKVLIKVAQQQSFARELHNLSRGCAINKNSKLLGLNTYLDNLGLLRVGGRLNRSSFSEDKKHPIVLPPHHTLSKLIMRSEHVRLLHAGPLACLASLRERFWPLHGRKLAKGIVKGCLKCYRVAPKVSRHIMGDLPSSRLESTRPFLKAGIDFAGPILIRDRPTRGFKLTKVYLAVFICFSTKAIHIEVVSDLSTQGFLSALRRFFSRRGMSSDLFTDNGTNFVGTKNEITKLYESLRSHSAEIGSLLAQDNVHWHFIPPRSPHFGGLWEANIKCAKNQIKRVAGNATLSYEDLLTLTCQIEACLNSRPLYPCSPNPVDSLPLTPAHFIIGESLTTIPDIDVTPVKENRLAQFQRIQKMIQCFWKSWSRYYIGELQTRTKWKTNYEHLLKPGVLVIIKEDNLPPLKWHMGRVTDVHPGHDGIVRAATVRTAHGTFKRAAMKLCVLPVESGVE